MSAQMVLSHDTKLICVKAKCVEDTIDLIVNYHGTGSNDKQWLTKRVDLIFQSNYLNL